MPVPANEVDVPSADQLNAPVRLDLTRTDLALIIDALLQAEMTLPLIDRRYRAMKAIESLRVHQLALANRLEDLMAGNGLAGQIGKSKSQLEQDSADHQSGPAT